MRSPVGFTRVIVFGEQVDSNANWRDFCHQAKEDEKTPSTAVWLQVTKTVKIENLLEEVENPMLDRYWQLSSFKVVCSVSIARECPCCLMCSFQSVGMENPG